MNNKKIFCLISIVITISLVTASSYHWDAIILAYAVSSNSPEGISIKAGSGNSTAPLTTFTPQKVEIKKGDTVRWYNPTQVGDDDSYKSTAVLGIIHS